MERLHDSLQLSCPESRNSHTDGAYFLGKEQEFLTYRSYRRSGSLHRREEPPAPVELIYRSYPLALELVLHSAISGTPQRLPDSLQLSFTPFMQPNLLQTVAAVLRRS